MKKDNNNLSSKYEQRGIMIKEHSRLADKYYETGKRSYKKRMNVVEVIIKELSV